jgi:hypothetical protein
MKTKEDRTLLRALGGRLTNQSHNIKLTAIYKHWRQFKTIPLLFYKIDKMVKACFICGAKDIR